MIDYFGAVTLALRLKEEAEARAVEPAGLGVVKNREEDVLRKITNFKRRFQKLLDRGYSKEKLCATLDTTEEMVDKIFAMLANVAEK